MEEKMVGGQANVPLVNIDSGWRGTIPLPGSKPSCLSVQAAKQRPRLRNDKNVSEPH